MTGNQLLRAYNGVAYPALFTALATYVSLFSKMASPVIIISQLGLFVGTAYIVFYAMFHYFIIPTWIVTSSIRFTMVERYLSDVTSRYSLLPLFLSAHEDQPITSDPTVVESSSNDSANGEHNHDPLHQMEALKVEPKAIIEDPKRLSTLLPSSIVVRGSGVFALLIWMALLLIVVLVGIFPALQIDFSVPQLFSPTTNMGQAFVVMKNYKSQLFSLSSKADSFPLVTGKDSPTQQPGAPPVSSPVSSPTSSSSSFSASPSTVDLFSSSPSSMPYPAPSSIPTTHSPTSIPSSSVPSTMQPSGLPISAKPMAVPSLAPTSFQAVNSSSPTTLSGSIPTKEGGGGSSSSQFIDYTVNSCWGVSESQQYIDESVTATWNTFTFMPYSNDKHFLFSDLERVCSNVESNRAHLCISPSWNKKRDCIYDQLIEANNTLSILPESMVIASLIKVWGSNAYDATFRNKHWTEMILLFWASKTKQTSFLGADTVYFPNSTSGAGAQTAVLMPSWYVLHTKHTVL